MKSKSFYPDSNSFPWSLRSAAQSSDRQFFSNQVWRGNSKVHSSYDLILLVHWAHQQIFRLGGSIVLLLELSSILIQDGHNLYSIWSLMVFGLRLNHAGKHKSCGEVQCNVDEFQINAGAERCKSLHFSRSADSGETHVGQVRGGRKENKRISLFGFHSRKANRVNNKLVTNTKSL